MKFAYKLCVFEFFSSYSIKSRKFAMECYSGNGSSPSSPGRDLERRKCIVYSCF
jgi:hypothetical protein